MQKSRLESKGWYMSTNPAGKGTKTIGINMKAEMAADIEKRAKSMGISTGMYRNLSSEARSA